MSSTLEVEIFRENAPLLGFVWFCLILFGFVMRGGKGGKEGKEEKKGIEGEGKGRKERKRMKITFSFRFLEQW